MSDKTEAEKRFEIERYEIATGKVHPDKEPKPVKEEKEAEKPSTKKRK